MRSRQNLPFCVSVRFCFSHVWPFDLTSTHTPETRLISLSSPLNLRVRDFPGVFRLFFAINPNPLTTRSLLFSVLVWTWERERKKIKVNLLPKSSFANTYVAIERKLNFRERRKTKINTHTYIHKKDRLLLNNQHDED